MTNFARIRLNFWTCYFLNSDSYYLTGPGDINRNHNNGTNGSHQVELYCNGHGAYISHSDAVGRAICILLVALTCCIGLFGIVANVMNVLVFTRSYKSDGGFQFSLLLLSTVNLVLCVSTTGFAYLTLLISENIARGQVTMILFTVFRILQALTRTTSVYLSILFAMERYIAIAIPFQFSITYKRKRVLAVLLVVAFCLVMNVPWMTKYKIVKNDYVWADDSSWEIMEFPYLTDRVGFAKRLPSIIRHFLLAFDYFLPFPLIFLFHLLFYLKIREWKRTRPFLTRHQIQNIHRAKLFTIMVSVILAYYSLSFVVYIVTRFQNIFRELYALLNLGVVIGGSADFLVYYMAGTEFRKEFWKMIAERFGDRCVCNVQKNDTCSSRPTTITQIHSIC